MNPETGSFARCVKHPSQFSTGFCLTCLVERLSNVDSVESIGSSSCDVKDEVLEISEAIPDSQMMNDGVRVRKTLLSLFQLDDLHDLEKKMEHVSAVHNVCYGESSEIVKPALDTDEKSVQFEDESLADRRMSIWLHSKFLMKGLKWRSRSTSKKGRRQERCLNTEIEDRYVENKPKLRISCHWMDSADPSSVCWEKPRHSWDGSLMSKALSCSFSCLEERRDGSDKIKESLPDEAAASDLERSFGANYVGEVKNGILTDNNCFPRGDFPKGACKNITFSDGCRKKPNGWSRVWDWSISSPFRDFGKKNGHVLERSLSESWRDKHRDRNRSGGDSNGDIVAASVSRHGQNPNLQKMREFKLSRSHSVRYSSPRNIDNGLLRFYLTPLRSSRRNTVKCRRRTSQFFR